MKKSFPDRRKKSIIKIAEDKDCSLPRPLQPCLLHGRSRIHTVFVSAMWNREANTKDRPTPSAAGRPELLQSPVESGLEGIAKCTCCLNCQNLSSDCSLCSRNSVAFHSPPLLLLCSGAMQCTWSEGGPSCVLICCALCFAAWWLRSARRSTMLKSILFGTRCPLHDPSSWSLGGTRGLRHPLHDGVHPRRQHRASAVAGHHGL